MKSEGRQNLREKFRVDIFGDSSLQRVANEAAARWEKLRAADTQDYAARLVRHLKGRVAVPEHRLRQGLIGSVALQLPDFVRHGVSARKAEEFIAGLPSNPPTPPSFLTLVIADGVRFVNAAVSRHRQEQMGITSYKWGAIDDGKEDPEHVQRDGSVYRWGNVPPAGGHPGEDVGCRCQAEPVISSWNDLEQKIKAERAQKSSFLRGFFSGLFGKGPNKS
jgi:SPP1 gp7 family putative phage head morphogenesis protein